MGMILVACENFEAYNNVQRARDYYGRDHPSLRDAFATVRRFVREGLVTSQVYDALRDSTLEGELDALVRESQGLASRCAASCRMTAASSASCGGRGIAQGEGVAAPSRRGVQ